MITKNINLWFLIITQTLFMIINMMFVTLAPLMGKQLLVNTNYSTLPLAITMLSMLIFSFPLSMWMGKSGRAIVFKSGIVASIFAGGVFFTALMLHQFWLLLIGGVLFGYSVSCANFYRFAAMEMVKPKQQASAMSMIMAVGVIAGLIGPNLSRYTKELYFDVSFASSVLIFIPIPIVSLVFMFLIKWPTFENKKQNKTTDAIDPAKAVKTDRNVYKPIITAMIAYGVMVLIMSATPLHMDHHHYHFDDTAWVIQWHILGMFAPSFFIAYLSRNIGINKLLILGVLVMFLSIGVNLIADSKMMLTFGLLFLGIGWNFLFIGSSQWLMTFLHNDNRSKVQGINEVLVFGLSSIATLSSGWLINVLGWEALNVAALPLLIFLFVMLLKTAFEDRKEASLVAN